MLRWRRAGFAGGREERVKEVGAMKEVIYQRIKTYEIGIVGLWDCSVSEA